jgi:type I restriction enzyme S subunit
MKTLNLKSKDIVSTMRFDGSYHISEGTIFLKKLKRMPHADLISFCPNIFTAGRNKRVYTDKEKGFPYLSNSDVVKNNPFESCNYNSKKYGFDKTAFLKEGMILTGRVGAIGQTSYVTKEFEENQAMGSDNIIRIVAKDKKMSGYIYAFLVSKYGNALFNRLAAGGVQPYISEAMLQDIPIPILPEEFQQKIHNLIVESAQLRVEANKMLKEAVEIFEKEIGESKVTHSFQVGKISSNKIYGFHKRFDSQYQLGWNALDKEKKNNLEYIKLAQVACNIFVGGRGKRNYVENGVPFLSSSDILHSSLNVDNPSSSKSSVIIIELDSMNFQFNFIFDISIMTSVSSLKVNTIFLVSGS